MVSFKKNNRIVEEMQSLGPSTILVDLFLICTVNHHHFEILHFITTSNDDRFHALLINLLGVPEHVKLNEVHLCTLMNPLETGASHVITNT